MNLIEMKQVSKIFRKGLNKYTILDKINFTLRKGEFVVLQGGNGAGKTTLLNLILGIIQPSEGEVKLMGLSPKESSAKISVGVVLQETRLPQSLKVKELIQLVQSFYPNSQTVSDILRTVNLDDKSEAWARDLSGGQKQRLYFALALVGNPELLILDEPTRNLDDKSYEDFWKQIRFCQKQGISILMVTNNKSDWEELNELATRYVTLYNLSEAPAEGQLSESRDSPIKQNVSIPMDSSGASQSLILAKPQNNLSIFLQQMWVEIIQLLRTPSYLLGIMLFAGFSSLFPFSGEVAKQALTSFSILLLLIIALERVGKRITIERAEGWLKLLRVTPLPPIIYILAKIVTTLVLCTISIVIVMIVGVWRLKIQLEPQQLLIISLSLVLGALPFVVFGLAMGYLAEPKSYDSIAGLLLPIGLAVSGAVPLPGPHFLQDIVAFSPFYHYRELILWSTTLKDNQYILLHLSWLLWALGVFGVTSVWAYKRDSVVQ